MSDLAAGRHAREGVVGCDRDTRVLLLHIHCGDNRAEEAEQQRSDGRGISVDVKKPRGKATRASWNDEMKSQGQV